ncbi:MAG: lipid II flippase MurJ [Candidatus Dojkabacteria bacterium]|nr:MAG: lipid II flippase MurJ [Candidatus Dojkabacteria bacterium]
MSFLKKLFARRDTVIIISIILFFTKLFGFFKLRLIADQFGIDSELDIFWAAFLVPETIFNIIIAGTINAAVIPVFMDVRVKRGEQKLLKLFLVTSGAIAIFSMFMVFVLYVLTPGMSEFILESGYLGSNLRVSAGEEEKALLLLLVRIMLLSPLFLSVSSIITAFLQVHRRFFVTALAPLLYNVGMIFGSIIFVGYYDMGVEGLAWAMVLGSMLHVAVQIPIVVKFVKIHLKIEHLEDIQVRTKFYVTGLWEIIRLAVPRMLAFLGEQISSVINTLIAFNIASGALSAFEYAMSLHLFPVQIFVSAFSLVALPNLAEYFSRDKLDQFVTEFNKSLKQMMFIILPCVVAMVVLRLPIVRLVFSFEGNWTATVVTAWSLALLAGSMIAQAGNAITLRGLFALHETKLPLLVTVITIVVNIVCSYYLTNFFSHYVDWRPILSELLIQIGSGLSPESSASLLDIASSIQGDIWTWMTTRSASNASVGGLALSLSIAFVVEMTLNMFFLNRKVAVLSWARTFKPISLMMVNAFVMGAVMYFIYRLTDFSLDTTRTANIILLFIVTAIVGGSVYLLLSYLSGLSEVSMVNKGIDFVRRKLKFAV